MQTDTAKSSEHERDRFQTDVSKQQYTRLHMVHTTWCPTASCPIYFRVTIHQGFDACLTI